MSRPRVPGRKWCKQLSRGQLAALLFLADCPSGQHSWTDGWVRRPPEMHTATLRALVIRRLVEWTVERNRDDPAGWRKMTVTLSWPGEALIAAYRHGYDAGIEA